MLETTQHREVQQLRNGRLNRGRVRFYTCTDRRVHFDLIDIIELEKWSTFNHTTYAFLSVLTRGLPICSTIVDASLKGGACPTAAHGQDSFRWL